MRLAYFPSSDTLSLVFADENTDFPDGRDTTDDDVTFFYTDDGRIGEILICHASRRVDLDKTRRRIGFEEVREGAEAPGATS